MEEVARHFEVDPVRLQRRGKDAKRVEARGVACYLAVRLLGLASSEVGRLLGLGRFGVSRAAAPGEQSVRREPSLVDLASGGVNQLLHYVPFAPRGCKASALYSYGIPAAGALPAPSAGSVMSAVLGVLGVPSTTPSCTVNPSSRVEPRGARW